jgi:predicted O-methyltransferase YrrM
MYPNSHLHRLARKVAQVPSLAPADTWAYLTSPIRKLHSRFFCRRGSEFRTCSTTLNGLITALGCENGIKSHSLQTSFQDIVNNLDNYIARASTSDLQLIQLLYYIVRLYNPRCIIETGVWHGVSSCILLTALNENHVGQLISIDLPPMDPFSRVIVGGAVPKQLHSRWLLLKGSSRSLLHTAISNSESCDIFIHDGEHTYLNMMFEFRTIWPHMASGGLIIVDDAHWNDSVFDFRDQVNCEMWAMERTKGGFIAILRKPS